MEVEYQGVTYESRKELHTTLGECTGCYFCDHKTSECNVPELAPALNKCSGIIWVKKEEPILDKVQERIKEVIAEVQQGIKYDSNKLQYSLIPPLALEALARNLTAGLSKYPRDNWRHVENAEERYLDALYRHLEAHRKGEVYDSESSVDKMPHLAAVAVNAMFLLEFLLTPELTK